MQLCELMNMLATTGLVRGTMGVAYLFLGKCCLRNKQTRNTIGDTGMSNQKYTLFCLSERFTLILIGMHKMMQSLEMKKKGRFWGWGAIFTNWQHLAESSLETALMVWFMSQVALLNMQCCQIPIIIKRKRQKIEKLVVWLAQGEMLKGIWAQHIITAYFL